MNRIAVLGTALAVLVVSDVRAGISERASAAPARCELTVSAANQKAVERIGPGLVHLSYWSDDRDGSRNLLMYWAHGISLHLTQAGGHTGVWCPVAGGGQRQRPAPRRQP